MLRLILVEADVEPVEVVEVIEFVEVIKSCQLLSGSPMLRGSKSNKSIFETLATPYY